MISPATSFGRYFCFCASLPKSNSGMTVRLACAPNVAPIDPEQAEVASSFHQPPRERPVLFFEPVEHGQDFLVHELVRGPGDEPMLVGHALGRENAVSGRRLQKPFAAAE